MRDEVPIGEVIVNIKHDYLMELAKDALSEQKPIDGPQWLDYLVEALNVDHYLDTQLLEFYETWSEEERQILDSFNAELDQGKHSHRLANRYFHSRGADTDNIVSADVPNSETDEILEKMRNNIGEEWYG